MILKGCVFLLLQTRPTKCLHPLQSGSPVQQILRAYAMGNTADSKAGSEYGAGCRSFVNSFHDNWDNLTALPIICAYELERFTYNDTNEVDEVSWRREVSVQIYVAKVMEKWNVNRMICIYLKRMQIIKCSVRKWIDINSIFECWIDHVVELVHGSDWKIMKEKTEKTFKLQAKATPECSEQDKARSATEPDATVRTIYRKT